MFQSIRHDPGVWGENNPQWDITPNPSGHRPQHPCEQGWKNIQHVQSHQTGSQNSEHAQARALHILQLVHKPGLHRFVLREWVHVGLAHCGGAGSILSGSFTPPHCQIVGPIKLARLPYKTSIPAAISRLSAAVGDRATPIHPCCQPSTSIAPIHRLDMVIQVQGNVDMVMCQALCRHQRFHALYQGHCSYAHAHVAIYMWLCSARSARTN
eukprot:jgi/Ulvmu1/8140/UM040_0036.1